MLAAVTGTADHVLRNRAVWDRWAADYAGPGLRSWSAAEPTWGIWGIPEAQAGVLPADLDGPTASSWAAAPATSRPGWPAAAPGRSAWTTRAAQLATARRLQDRFGLRFPLVHASAEQAPFADASFDLAISRVRRQHLVRPVRLDPRGGPAAAPRRGADLPGNSVLLMLTVPDEDGLPATERLLRPVLRHAPVRMAR